MQYLKKFTGIALGLIGFLVLSGCQSTPVHRAPVVNLRDKSKVYRPPLLGSNVRQPTSAVVSKPPKLAIKAPVSRRTPIGRTQFHHPPRASKPVQRSMMASNMPVLSKPAALRGSPQWDWPVRGDIIRRFKSQGKGRGIDITGISGTPVKAAAQGVVVYSGNGLKGYGNLIIIKHNEDFLSAYAHNRDLKVKEGEPVRRGQEIAAMGQSDAECVKLYFEIRDKGKPVDPLKYLP